MILGMEFAIFILAASSLIASGVLFRHMRMFTFIAAACVLFEAAWLLLTCIDRVLLPQAESWLVFTLGGLLGAAILLRRVKLFRLPYQVAPRSGRRDMVVFLVMLPAVVSAWMILEHNGFTAGGSWVTHGFYNGDTMTFLSLVQRSFLTESLVTTNPFAGGGELEYPTLLHAGVAEFIMALGGSVGSGWLHFLPLLVYVQILATIPLFFLVWDVMYPEKLDHELWLGVPRRWPVLVAQADIVLLVMSYSWDSFVFIQSHFLLTGIFLLMGALIAQKHMWLANAAALILMLSNAVTGTAAVAVAVIVLGTVFFNDAKTALARAGAIFGIAVWIGLFLWATPGNAAFGMPGFSYTAAEQMTRMAPLVIALFVGVVLGIERQRLLVAITSGLSALTFLVFFVSTREIVVENAERFFYHAILLGFPLLLLPAIRLYYFIRRLLVYTTLSFPQRAGGWVAVGGACIVLILPGAASAGRTLDSLLHSDERSVSFSSREGMWWLAEHADANAVVLASPDSPWEIPLFSGLALLRADYWLGDEDELLDLVMSAFQSEGIAYKRTVLERDNVGLIPREEAIARISGCLFDEEFVGARWCQDLQQADYVLLKQDELPAWALSRDAIVFTNTHTTIYRTK